MINTRHSRTLTWDETATDAWKWLTFGQLCDIADRGRDEGISVDCFVYVHPEYATVKNAEFRVDQILIDEEIQ